MTNEAYGNAFAEVLEILKYIEAEDAKKIPNEIIEIMEKYKNPLHIFKFIPNITLDENNVLEETKEVLAYLFINYWATKEQKIKIKRYRFYMQEKRNMQDPDFLTKNTNLNNKKQ